MRKGLQSTDIQKRKSVGELTLELAILAGMERALIRSLEMYASDSSLARFNSFKDADRVVDILNGQVDEIKHMIQKIRNTISLLDPSWVRDNPRVVIDVGSFAHDGLLFYATPVERWALTDPQFSNALVGALQEEKERVSALAEQLHHDVTQVPDRP